MEMYANLIVEIEDDTWQKIKEIVATFTDIDSDSYSSGFGRLAMMGSSDLAGDIHDILNKISEKTSNPVLVWLDGDEDPEPELISLISGKITSNTLSSSYFEYLEEADEDELDCEDLNALDLGASKYFEAHYQEWIKPYRGQFDDSEYRESLSDVIDMC